MRIKTYPKTVTVKIEDDGDSNDYLVANSGDDMLGHAEVGKKIKVGIYKLVEVREVEGVAQTRVLKGRAG